MDHAEAPTATLPRQLSGELTLTPVWERIAEKGKAAALPTQRVVEIGPEAGAAWNREAWIEQLKGAGPFDHLVWRVPVGEPQVTITGLRLIQALLALDYGTRPFSLTVVTRQALAVWPDEATDPEQASVHGLIGSLAKEYENWRVNLLDLPAQGALPQLDEVPGESQDEVRGETRAWRDGHLYRQRLAPCTLPEATTSAYREGGVYVILGGAGGIGAAFSEYLIRQYRAQVIWLGRRAPDETIAQQCARLGTLGPTPLYLQADATDRDALELGYLTIRERYGVIHGVVHAAIVLADRSLAQMEEATFEAALSAKTTTTVNLEAVFGQAPLDFLLFFSSIQSFMQAPGQGNYAAGCCFADAFAQGLQGRPYPVKVVNWGYWGSVGVVASAPYRKRMAQVGLDSIEPPEAMAVLERLLAGPVDRVALIKTMRADAAQALGVTTRETVMVMPTAPAIVLPEALAMALPETASAVFHSLEQRLGKLLRALLAKQGWMDGEVGLAERYTRWHEVALQLLPSRDLADALADWDTQWPQWETYREQVSDDAVLGAQVRLADAVLRALPAVLRGERVATEVLFPNGQLELVEGIYRDHPVADYFNAVLGERLVAYVEARLAQDPQARLRIVEIGAGTGGTSVGLFARLAPYASHIDEYAYTDVSAAFLLHAQTHYAQQAPYLKTQRLDIERSPVTQGFEAGRYDVVVAANVLHATSDIRRTVRHAKTLLKGQGLLL
ncbi:TPA: SDR family NAD(P)-dependent oxidoreductase, partial [Burkholderia cepacia]|nr:SDR family NAD(P)-dependent oxidoreductase [Burkholderia cepacia]